MKQVINYFSEEIIMVTETVVMPSPIEAHHFLPSPEVVLQPVAPVNEGDIAVVCVEDMDPDISRDFNVTVTLNVTSGTATGQSKDSQMLISSSLVPRLSSVLYCGIK